MDAIRVEGLSKLYRIGAPERLRRSLRETVASAFAAPFRRGRAPEPSLLWALREVSFTVAQGEIVGVIGRNGAGKSTLLKILSRITEPTRGDVRLRGRVASLLEVGTGFHGDLTGRENVFLNGAILGMTRAEIRRKFDAIVAFAGVDRFVDTPVKHYSSGMYMRLAFAVAAHLEPEILLVDEVLAVGDAEFQEKCLGKMRDVGSSGRTVVFVSHNLPAIQSLCSRAVLLENGGVRRIGGAGETVLAYLSAMESRGRRESAAREIDPRSRAAFVSWRVAGRDEPAIQTGDPLPLEFRVVFRKAARDVSFAVSLRSGDGTLVWGANTRDRGERPRNFAPGEYVATFEIGSAPLRMGNYWLEAVVYTAEGRWDLWHAFPSLKVLPKRPTAVSPGDQGFMDFDFDYRAVPAAEGGAGDVFAEHAG